MIEQLTLDYTYEASTNKLHGHFKQSWENSQQNVRISDGVFSA